MHRSGLLLAAFFGTAAIPLAAPTAAPAVSPLGGDVALQAGRVQLSATSHMDDATILVKDGKIIAIGTDVDVPAGVRVVDYGDDAVIAPGLVCADSSYGSSIAGPRTAEPTVLAVDNFDPYSEMFDSLRAGVTSVYMAPSRSRLVAGQGAVVKTGGEANSGRVVSDAALLHGSVTAEARRTPGYWVPSRRRWTWASASSRRSCRAPPWARSSHCASSSRWPVARVPSTRSTARTPAPPSRG
ncbi:MAG: hypothetical protein O2816_01185 [Planctomycetota bacterium]|nr:hypothetical protein [Planctomycetota bacterium]